MVDFRVSTGDYDPTSSYDITPNAVDSYNRLDTDENRWEFSSDQMFQPSYADPERQGLHADVSDSMHSWVIEGGDFNDVMIGSNFNDGLLGGPGDILEGGAGADYLSGFKGTTASYYTSPAGVTIDLSSSHRSVRGSGGDAQGDILHKIDNLIGSDFADDLTGGHGRNTLTGGGGADILNGFSGNDYLLGGAGKDIIIGGDGTDQVVGGGGNDVIVFQSLEDFGKKILDTVLDFSGSLSSGDHDKLDLSSIANFTFVGGNAFDGKEAELRADAIRGGYIVSGDVDEDGAADFSFSVMTHAPLSQADFASGSGASAQLHVEAPMSFQLSTVDLLSGHLHIA